jgi:hypothetical protein
VRRLAVVGVAVGVAVVRVAHAVALVCARNGGRQAERGGRMTVLV